MELDNPELLLLEIEGILNDFKCIRNKIASKLIQLKLEFNRISSDQDEHIPQNLENFIEYVSKTGTYV